MTRLSGVARCVLMNGRRTNFVHVEIEDCKVIEEGGKGSDVLFSSYTAWLERSTYIPQGLDAGDAARKIARSKIVTPNFIVWTLPLCP
jgi:hypothetical protein